jgi:hypothetical protein
MEVNIEMYGARFDRIVPERKVEGAMIMKGQEDSANTVCFLGLLTLVLATSPTSGGRSVGIVRLWTSATEFSLV